MTQLECEVNCKMKTKNEVKEKILSVRLNGTTYSGHPTRTTLGNTLRVLSYLSYACYKVDGSTLAFRNRHPFVRFFVSGDDVMIKGERAFIDKIRIEIEKMYVISDKFMHEQRLESESSNAYGLGLTIKK